MSVFGAYARYYDLLNAGKDYRAEAEYVDWLLRHAQAPSRRVLDLGCGTGLHAAALADLGYEVTAVDRSETMLAMAEKRAGERLRFVQGDLREVRVEATFGAVVSLFHVMSYQTAQRDLRGAFETARVHLQPGGVFLFDCWYGPAVLTERPEVRTRTFEDETVEVTRLAEPVMHPNENVVDVRFRVTVREKATGAEEELREVHRMRYLFMPELEALLGDTGFTLLRAEEWMTGRQPGFDTWSVCLVARAAER